MKEQEKVPGNVGLVETITASTKPSSKFKGKNRKTPKRVTNFDGCAIYHAYQPVTPINYDKLNRGGGLVRGKDSQTKIQQLT